MLLGELAERLGYNQSTCACALKTLVACGFVDQPSPRKGYTLGPMACYIARHGAADRACAATRAGRAPRVRVRAGRGRPRVAGARVPFHGRHGTESAGRRARHGGGHRRPASVCAGLGEIDAFAAALAPLYAETEYFVVENQPFPIDVPNKETRAVWGSQAMPYNPKARAVKLVPKRPADHLPGQGAGR